MRCGPLATANCQRGRVTTRRIPRRSRPSKRGLCRVSGIQGLLPDDCRIQVDYALSEFQLYEKVSDLLERRGARGTREVERLKHCARIALELKLQDGQLVKQEYRLRPCSDTMLREI